MAKNFNMRFYLFFLVLILLFTACNSKFSTVYADLETTPVKSKEDAADDPAIFIHPTNPYKSAVIGTDKQRGLVIYDINGEIVHEYDFGRINNVDIRQNVEWNGKEITVVGGSNRTDNSLVFYQLDENTLELRPLFSQKVSSKVDEVYGFCLYNPDEVIYDNFDSRFYAFVVGKDGQVEMHRLSLSADGSRFRANIISSFNVGSQCEGLVADDEYKVLYVGEEEVGIWKYELKGEISKSKKQVQLIKDNKALKADIEGLTIYYGKEGEGYLIASSQGNNSYAIFERTGDHKYLGSFKIKASENIENTFDTDGIDVTHLPFGDQFPNGIFIAQDGKNGKEAQNFKIVDWKSIEMTLFPNVN